MQNQAFKKDDLPDGVAERIRTQILSGDLSPGDAVPPERVLAAKFGVNRTTVREAMRELEYAGLVARFQGKGCVVLNFREHGSLELLRYLLQLKDYPALVLEAAKSMVDVMQSFYCSAVALIIDRAETEELRVLLSLSETMGEAIVQADPCEVYGADYRFHRVFARATHSLAYELQINNFFESDLSRDVFFRPCVTHLYIEEQVLLQQLPHYNLAKALLVRDEAKALDCVEQAVEKLHKAVDRLSVTLQPALQSLTHTQRSPQYPPVQ